MEDQKVVKVQLKRELGLMSGTAIIVGTMIGSGIFISPGGVLKRSGSVAMSLIVWLLCGVTSCLASVAYMELGTLMPETGGEYNYLFRAFGNLAGFLYGWISTICIRPASYGILCQSFASYAVEPFYSSGPGGDEHTEDMLKEISMIKTAVTIVTMMRLASIMQNYLTLAKLAALLFIFVGGVYKLSKGNTTYLAEGFNHVESTDASISSIALAFYSGLWAYDGWNQLNFITGELKNPLRNLPLAIVLGVPIVTFLYISANVSYLTLLSPKELHESKAVVITWAGRFFTDDDPDLAYIDQYLPWVMSAFVAMSTFGAASSALFTAARMTFAAARGGNLPEVLSYIHKSWFTPLPSLAFITVEAIFMVVVMDINTLVDLFSFSSWIFYGGCFLAVIVLRFTGKELNRPIKVWIVIPIICVLLSVYLVVAPIINDPAVEYLFVLAFIAAGLILYVPFVHYKLRSPGLQAFNGVCRKLFWLSQTADDDSA